ncbi:MAG: PilW family protein [Planctomycetota bacterium]|jgi:prepilin-type N-terminal cleavage/methylation domain-containing protein
MKEKTHILCRQQGSTLLELLIALAITGIITTSILRLYTAQHESYLVQDDVAIMQQNARVCIDELTRQIRMAGHRLPLGMQPIEASNTNPDTITIRYQGNDCDTYLTAAMPQPSAELKCAFVDCFFIDQWVYIYDVDEQYGEWFQISQVQSGSDHLQHRFKPKELTKAYDADALVLVLDEVKYYIDNTNPNQPNLMMKRPMDSVAQVYAENISDLQFRYKMANGSVVDEPVVIEDVREVQMVVKSQSTRAQYQGLHEPTDDIPTRTFASSVSLRNNGLRE